MAFAKIVGLVVTPDTPRSRSAARLPLISLSRLRSSSQIDTPAARSLASESVIGSSEIVVACVSAPGRRVVGPARGRAGWSVASGHDAAVDVPDGAGHPAGGGGQQEGDGVGQVTGGADPAERVEAVEAVQRLVELVLGDEPLVQRGGHDGGGDRVD